MTSLTNAGKIAEAADEFGKYIYGTAKGVGHTARCRTKTVSGGVEADAATVTYPFRDYLPDCVPIAARTNRE
jgi:hypothetical protein